MQLDNHNIAISIVCNTYNQKDYIRDALDGFLMQKTNFAFEILVHDDASTDGTTDIVREYEKKYPDLIKPIYQTENQYSKRIGITNMFQAPRAKGKYIAFCEGDDYWTDPLKLQKQYEAMEEHPEVDMCAHKTLCVNANSNKAVEFVEPEKETKILSIEQVIFGGGNYVATNSLMYRKELYQHIPPFRQLLSCDYTWQIHGALRGGMLYLNDCMSVYRVQAKGSWTNRMEGNVELYLKFLKRKTHMLLQLDEDTNFLYTHTIRKVIPRDFVWVFKTHNRLKDFLTKEYKWIFAKLSFKERLKIRLKVYFPFLVKIKRLFIRYKQ